VRSHARYRREIAARVLVFLLGCGLMGGTAYYLGLPPVHAVVIAGVGGVLSSIATELPWGGFLLPSDAIVLSVCLITGRFWAVGVALGAALASASVVSRWPRLAAVASMRNLGASVAAVAVWRSFLPEGGLEFEGSRTLVVGPYAQWVFSVRAIPALLVAVLTFFVVGAAIDVLLRRRAGFNLREFWFFNFGKNFHHLIFTLLIGAIVSVAYLDMGMLAFVLFAFPLLLTRDALKRSLDLRKSRIEALTALSSSVDARDRYTYDHSSRVSQLASMLAREMGFSESTVETIESGALLHDIGKIGMDVEILSKPGPLDNEERAAIRQHPIRSAQVVSGVELFKSSVDIVRHHHERPDGNGYPDGLAAHEIPIGARILNVADAFDAMTSDRPYRKRRSVGEALEELKNGSGSEFDPVVVEYLMRLLKKRAGEIGRLGPR